MTQNQIVQQVMKTHTMTIEASATVKDAADRMDIYQVDELPVLDADGTICGVISETAIAWHVNNCLSKPGTEEADTLLNASVRDLMRVEYETVFDTDNISQRLIEMLLTEKRRVTVVDSRNRVVGSLNRIDIVQGLLEGQLVVAHQNS